MGASEFAASGVQTTEAGRLEAANKSRGFSWLIALLLLSCLALNYIDRQTLAVLVRFLPGELKMSNITYAHITTAFIIGNALTVPISGWLMDRLGARLGLSISVALWSFFEMLCGTARSVPMMGGFRFLLGIPEAAAIPAVAKVAGEHAAPHARATLIGISMFGIGMGTTFAAPVVAFLTEHFDWRWAFFGTGLLGFVWVAVWLMLYKTRLSAAAETPRPDANAPWVTLLRDKNVIGITLAHIFSSSMWWFYLYWIPPFLSQERHLNIHEIGIYGWIPFFFASIGSAWGGYASGWLVRRGWEPVKARKSIMWLAAAIVPFTCFVVKVPGLPGVLTLLAIATFFMQAFFANLFALPADLFPHQRVASVVGLNVMCNYLASIAVIQFTGHVVERINYTPVFALIAFFLPTGAILAHWLVHAEAPRASANP